MKLFEIDQYDATFEAFTNHRLVGMEIEGFNINSSQATARLYQGILPIAYTFIYKSGVHTIRGLLYLYRANDFTGPCWETAYVHSDEHPRPRVVFEIREGENPITVLRKVFNKVKENCGLWK